MPIFNDISKLDRAAGQVHLRKSWPARSVIGSRWRPGHRVRRDNSGSFEEVNCLRPQHQRDHDGEVLAWFTACVLVLLASSAVMEFRLAPALELFAVIAFTLALALMVGLLIWVVWGDGCGPKT